MRRWHTVRSAPGIVVTSFCVGEQENLECNVTPSSLFFYLFIPIHLTGFLFYSSPDPLKVKFSSAPSWLTVLVLGLPLPRSGHLLRVPSQDERSYGPVRAGVGVAARPWRRRQFRNRVRGVLPFGKRPGSLFLTVLEPGDSPDSVFLIRFVQKDEWKSRDHVCVYVLC